LSAGVAPDEVLAAWTQAEEDADLRYLAEAVPSALSHSLDGLDRIAAIVRSLKEFAYHEEKEMTEVDLNRALRSTLTVAAHEYKLVADVEMDLAELPGVMCRAGEMNQVFLNLIVNAAHAIGDVAKVTGKKGRITIRTEVKGDDVVLTVADTGIGIPEGIRARIFEPFFTTKELGKGTGQGLAIAHKVVLRHSGTLTFESEEGRGTTFMVRIPIEQKKNASSRAA
jgi:signal transduction histidine kinase